MTKSEIDAETARLKKLLQAREGKPGFAKNCEAIKARIEDLGTIKPE